MSTVFHLNAAVDARLLAVCSLASLRPIHEPLTTGAQLSCVLRVNKCASVSAVAAVVEEGSSARRWRGEVQAAEEA